MSIRKGLTITLVIVLCISLVACSGSAGKKASKGGIELSFWHAMGGAGGEAIKDMVDDFNKKHDDIKVDVQFQGTYDEAINKLKTAMQGKSGPDVVQIYDIGSRFMIDSGWIVPMQKAVDADNFDLSQLEPNLIGYYTIDDKLYSIPFNSSTPILYYNKDVFKEVGLDPEKPPETFEEIHEYCEKLAKGSVDYGYAMSIYGWFFEQLIAKQGQLYANNDNGRESNATAVEFDTNGAGLKILEEWKKLIDSGNAGNYGRKNNDTRNAFIGGKTAMIIDSTAVLGQIMTEVGGRFEVGTGFLPGFADSLDDGGVIIGGASLWMLDKGDEQNEKAAWEFVKHMISAEQQVMWNKATGYFPITTKAYEIDEMNKHLEEYPQFKTAIDQLHTTPINTFTKGALIGVFPEARQTIETNIEAMIEGSMTPEEAINRAAEDINKAMDNYNKTVK